MKKLNYSDIFNQDTLNIFTDASIKNMNGETVGCPGAVVVYCNNYGIPTLLDTGSYIIRHSTNNNSEISAILLGVNYALKYKDNFKTINLFSDSNICVQGLTKWIFDWVNCTRNGIMYSSSGNPVANQEIILNIIHTIVNHQLDINIYHQKGHVNINSRASLDRANSSMLKTNNLNKISEDLLVQLSIYNDMVDLSTKSHLEEYYLNYKFYKNENSIKLFNPLPIEENKMKIYKPLIKRRK